MKAILCLLLGYLLGCVHPAARISKKKNVDLRTVGTHNLGASNALLTFGKASGAVVMAVDIAKAVIAAHLARLILPKLAVAPLLGGLGAVTGHIYPAQLHFRGGKGLAAFGGMVLAYDPMIFLILLLLGTVFMLAVDHTVAMPMSAALFFPVAAGIKSHSISVGIIAACASTLIIAKHWSNLQRTLSGEDTTVRELVATVFSK